MKYIESRQVGQFDKIENFKGKTVSCNSYWNDNTSFALDIGDGELFDKNGEPIFYHVEYNLDNGKWHFVFEIWWEESNALITDELNENEKHELEMIVKHLIMYQDIKDIDYVLYINNSDGKLHMTDLTDRATTTDKGDLWFEGAYGNCLIALNNAKVTDKLYLIKKENLIEVKTILMNNKEKAIEFLENHAEKIITR